MLGSHYIPAYQIPRRRRLAEQGKHFVFFVASALADDKSFLVSFWDAKKKPPVRREDGKEKRGKI